MFLDVQPPPVLFWNKNGSFLEGDDAVREKTTPRKQRNTGCQQIASVAAVRLEGQRKRLAPAEGDTVEDIRGRTKERT